MRELLILSGIAVIVFLIGRNFRTKYDRDEIDRRRRKLEIDEARNRIKERLKRTDWITGLDDLQDEVLALFKAHRKDPSIRKVCGWLTEKIQSKRANISGTTRSLVVNETVPCN